MDLDELKTIWQRHDSQLENNLTLNEQILLQMKLDRTNNEFRKLMNFEVVSVICSFVVVLILIYFTFRQFWSPLYLALGFISGAIMLMYLVFSMLQLSGFSKLCSYDESVVKVQKELVFQKRRLLRFRKIEIVTIPLCMAAIFPLLSIAVYDFDILWYPGRYLIGVAVACAITIPVLIWLYRTFYDKRIASAEALLQSISEFEENK